MVIVIDIDALYPMAMSAQHDHPHGTPSDWSAHAATALARRGGRRSTAREAVLGALAAQDCCASAQEIHERLRAEGTRVGIASVYRTLELLHDQGLVTRVDTGDGVARFEPALPGGEHHHHVVCTRCGAVEPFEDEALEAAIQTIGARVDFEVTGHDVALRGRCRACRAA
jgi:Fur family ferric uptake transcriptional regulator